MTRLEKSLPQPEVFYRSLLESAGDRVWVVDREGRYLFVNEPVERKLGLKREEILRKTYGDLHSAKDNQDFLERVKRVFGDEVVTYEYFFPRNRRWSLRTMSPVREPSGEIIAVSILSKDITERKKAEEKLKEYADNLGQLVRERTKETRFLSNIAASISQSIMVQDNNRKIVYVNKAFEDMYGYSKEEVIGKPASMLAPEGMADETHCEITRGLEARGYWSGEILRKRKNGEIFPVWITVSHLRDEKGEIVGRFGVSTDMTERKKLENQLRFSEERLRRIFNNAPIGILVTDAKGNFLEANEGACHIFRSSKEELLKLNFYELRDKRTLRSFEKALCGEVSEYVGPYHTHLRGLDTWLRTVHAPILGVKGKIVGVTILVEDITERKELENRLQESAERLRRIFDHAPVGIILMDEDGNFLEVNEQLCRDTGASKEELLKLNFRNLRDERMLPSFEKALRGEVSEYIGPYTTTTKRSIWVRVVMAPILDTEGKIVGVVNLSEDITEKKKLEDKLQLSEERLRRIFDHVPVGIILTDKEGNYVEVNNFQCRSLSKAPREGLLRQNYFHQRDRSLQPFFKKALQGEVAENEGWYTTTAKGLTYWVRTIFAPVFDSDGKTDGVIILSEDRTERKRLEEQLLNQTRLATIGATAASVGHDLRNPLQVIVNSLFLVKNKFEQMPTPFREFAEEQGLVEQCGTIEKQVEYMNKIVSDLQDYARPVKPELMETDIHKLISDTLSTITVPENIKVTTVIEEDFPKLMIDSAMIKRVLTNLTTNAVQAMPDGGRLTMKASKEGETASIRVEDTGVGIRAENMEKLFQPLFTTKAKGVGLGLAVCRRMVEAHGGDIVVESKVGKGSTFTVKIPLRREVT